MADAASAVDILYGSLKLVSTYRIEGETVYLGGYSISFDQSGRETSRTENSWTGTISNVPAYCLPLLMRGERIA